MMAWPSGTIGARSAGTMLVRLPVEPTNGLCVPAAKTGRDPKEMISDAVQRFCGEEMGRVDRARVFEGEEV